LRLRWEPDDLSEDIGSRILLPELHLAYQSLAAILLVGVVVGWIAAKFMTKYGTGIVGDIIDEVIGAYIENCLLPRLGVHFGAGFVRASLTTIGDAIVLLLLIRSMRRV
jgi:uncharacterized membrane protein YeaQ/YmgE (transglycosylase-associated protein family)